MADPITGGLAAASLVSGIAGGVASAAGTAQSSAAQSQAYTYQAGIAAQNQLIAQQNESYALMQGEQQAAQSGMKARSQAGQIRAAQGASGLNVNTGTNVDVQKGQSQIAGMEQTAIRSSSAKAAYDYDISGFQAGEQANLYKMAAANVKSAAPLAEAASILGSASSVSSKWAGFQQSGALNGIGNAFSNATSGIGF
jgi:hypothetical protein